MMNRRSTSRSRRRSTEMQATSESRQPQQEDGRSSRRSSSQQQSNNNVPRSPRSTPGNQQQQTTPSKSQSSMTHPKTRCYRLNLEKPFDIRTCKSPLGRDYSGPPIHESDLPPAAGPVEYIPPIHLCSKEEINARRHSWGGVYARSFQQSMSNMGADLMMNLHVSNSDDSTNSNSNSTTIAITTARIFRGIEVDRNGVITSMNDRAKRSAAKNGGSSKTKVGEKSRQAAKIDKAKDLIDDVDGGGGGAGGMSDEENDPTKIVSLFVMGEYEDLNDLVRDGSKKLRDSKSVSDETLFSYNRPSPYRSQGSSQGGFGSSSGATGGPLSPIQQDVTMSSAPVPPPPSQGPSSPIANIRKRVFSADKSRSRSYKQVPRSAPPKLKSNPRDSSGTTTSSRRTSRSSPRSSSQQQQPASSPQATYDRQQSIHGHAGGPFGCVPLSAHGATTSSVDPSKGGSTGQHSNGHYFQQNCNFFPGQSDWTEALGNFNLWNCGANVPLSRTMSPHSNPSSPRNGDPNGGGQPQDFHSPRVTGGGVYHGSGAPVSPHQHTSYHSSSGYHHQQQHVHHHHQHHQGSTSVNSGYTGYGTPQYRDEGRNPSYNHRSSGVGARDTVVM